jgi:hypothetical protein
LYILRRAHADGLFGLAERLVHAGVALHDDGIVEPEDT